MTFLSHILASALGVILAAVVLLVLSAAVDWAFTAADTPRDGEGPMS